MDLGLPRGPIGKDVFFSPGSSSHLGAAHSLFGGALFVLFVQEGAVLCWRSLFGVVSENAALFFEKEGCLFTVGLAGRIRVFPGCDVRA